ncbi:hypothetical protein Back11_38220 [Paenibacillus baekrokdamisoli]|uniref:Uncharacterized protein n=1 Tax=Paenibacillus baekrokdamisoli TaxID=1712516 RepID=A0A3G9IUB8_9BACL|nr:LytTR family transcriptional regulator DNA-binding domain-containing protein [Paenibacillus baekrokdamisoli]MBB3068481.1 DNA-binding LytR/AlgR family response regulator [Paenibacillus baekrokdamisoli]BBH22477.1 hypothetical protein Back11_38220 [Paenibacillus baekrokdamisoli]
MQIPVKDTKGNIHMLDVHRDVLYMQTNRKGSLLFHTGNEVFQSIQRVEEWALLLDSAGFLRVDRGTIVNLSKAWLYDPELKVINLQANEEPLYIPVSSKSIQEIIQALRGSVEPS